MLERTHGERAMLLLVIGVCTYLFHWTLTAPEKCATTAGGNKDDDDDDEQNGYRSVRRYLGCI